MTKMKTTKKMAEHTTEKRTREITDYICVQKGCKFKGMSAQQGVCHTTDSNLGGSSWKHVEQAEANAVDFVNDIKKNSKNSKDYTKHLEAYLICTWMNNDFMLDELVYLRKELALLKLKSITK